MTFTWTEPLPGSLAGCHRRCDYGAGRWILVGSHRLGPFGLEGSGASAQAGLRRGAQGLIEIAAPFRQGLSGIAPGQEVLVVTWFHLARRDVLTVHPRAASGTRSPACLHASPDRPNPLALHRVTVLKVTADGLGVEPMEAVDGTPVVDIKPVLSSSEDA